MKRSRPRSNQRPVEFALFRAPKGFPRRLEMTHEYIELVSFNATSGALGTYQFSCNGLFKPNTTAAGHQPLYFDNLCAIYDHYTCLSSSIKAEILQTTTTGTCVLYIEDDTTSATNIQAAAEHATAKIKTIFITATKPDILTNSWNARSYFGGNIFDNDDLQGTVAANPVEQSHYTFKTRSVDGSGTTATYLTVRILYHVVWDELNTQVQN